MAKRFSWSPHGQRRFGDRLSLVLPVPAIIFDKKSTHYRPASSKSKINNRHSSIVNSSRRLLKRPNPFGTNDSGSVQKSAMRPAQSAVFPLAKPATAALSSPRDKPAP
jgi:hypothetical protein